MIYMDDPIWFTPLNVIYHFTQLRSKPSLRGDRRYKKAEEAFYVAIMLVGIMVIQKRAFWMQIVLDEEHRPDIKTGCFRHPRGTPNNNWITQDVEEVQFEEHSKEDNLVDFLKRTKLSKAEPYGPLTTILCVIRKDFRIPPLRELAADIQRENCLSPIMIIGKTSQDKEVYKIAQISPVLELVQNFDLVEELNRNPHTGVLQLKRGMQPILDGRTDEKHYPFEKLGIYPEEYL